MASLTRRLLRWVSLISGLASAFCGSTWESLVTSAPCIRSSQELLPGPVSPHRVYLYLKWLLGSLQLGQLHVSYAAQDKLVSAAMCLQKVLRNLLKALFSCTGDVCQCSPLWRLGTGIRFLTSFSAQGEPSDSRGQECRA